LGQQIEELQNLLQNPGTYSVTWNAVNYASGIYFYSVEVKDHNEKLLHREMKKIILLK